MVKNILEDIRVIDCSIAMAGPFAAQRLGDLGADVIKVEPINGEWQRHFPAGGAAGNRINTSFLSLNRNKRSFAVDLKKPEGKEAVHSLVKDADIFLQNYRPGVAERLKLDYKTLSRINPSLIYVSVSGYGEKGPYKDRPGQDLLLQAMSGAMFSSGSENDPPRPAGQYLVDAVTASTAFEGALAALVHRLRTGEGQLVEVNMLDVIITLQMQELSIYTVGKKPQKRSAEDHAHVYIKAPYGVFKTADEKYISIAFSPLDALARLLDLPKLEQHDADDYSPQQRDSIFRLIAEAVFQYKADDILKKLDDAGMWVAPVYSYEEVLNDPQIEINQTFVEYEHPTEGRVKTPGFPIHFQKTPSQVSRGAPLVGEHTREILEKIGMTEQDIDKLHEDKVINAAKN